MNKTILLIFACIMAASLVLAAGTQSGTGNSGVTGSGQEVQTNTEQQTQNQGSGTQIQNQVQSGTYSNQVGEQMQIQAGEGNEIKLQSGNVEAKTSMNMTQERVQNMTQLKVQLSNGRNAEIKIMPDTASETALARLRMKVCNETNNCTIQLKEIGQGNQTKAVYEMKVQKQSKVLGLFKAKMQVQAQVDAENGEVIQSKKPWWAFLATEEA